MSLRKKTLIITVLAIGSLVCVLYFLSRLIVLNSYVKLEEQEVHRNVERVLNALHDDLTNLHHTTNDWSAWDDSYDFIHNRNKHYEEANLVDSTFTRLRLNLILFINITRDIIYEKSFDFLKEKTLPVPESLKRQFSAESRLLNHTTVSSNVSGILLLEEGPALVSSWPILTSEGTGPVRGTLIFARYLNSDEIKRLGDRTELSVSISRLARESLPAQYLMADASSSDKPQIQIKPLDANTVEGNTILKDIYGKPILLLRVTQQRQIYQQGQKSFLYFMGALTVAGLFFATVILILLEKQVLSRLLALNKSIRRIRESADLTMRVPVRGNDELSSLTQEINKMLGAQEQTEKMLKVFSLTDELTGLYNRRGFLSLAEQQLKIAERMNREMLLLYGDLNDLKTINDTYGHLQGDRALIDTAKIFKETFRESDIIARIGGDEFAVLTERKEDSNAEVLISRLKQNIDAYNEKESRPYKIGISIGIFLSDPKRSYTIEQLIAEADTNMYEQKREKQSK